jgi:hypothetical protein
MIWESRLKWAISKLDEPASKRADGRRVSAWDASPKVSMVSRPIIAIDQRTRAPRKSLRVLRERYLADGFQNA